MARPQWGGENAKREHLGALEPNPMFTRGEWDEVMRWRTARKIEAAERIPPLDELLSVIRNAVQKTRGAR